MPLSDDERNLIIGGGLVAGATLTAAILYSVLAAGPEGVSAKHSLSVEATSGGTTSPVPGFFKFDVPTVISVSAVVYEGFEFKGWYLNTVFAGEDLTLQVTVEGQNLLIASFEEINAPPLIPAYIKPIQNCSAEEWWHVWKETIYGSLGIAEYDLLHLEHDFYIDGFVKFKICDNAGNGVPDQEICVWADPMPDVTDFGHLLLAGAEPSRENPLTYVSDGDGVVAVPVRYKWVEFGNHKETIGRAGRVHYSAWWTSGDVSPIFDLLASAWYTSFTSFTRLLQPLYRTLNAVHAYWKSNPDLLVQGDAIADCIVKLEASHEF